MKLATWVKRLTGDTSDYAQDHVREAMRRELDKRPDAPFVETWRMVQTTFPPWLSQACADDNDALVNLMLIARREYGRHAPQALDT